MGRRCAALAVLLAMAGCAYPPEWQPPGAFYAGPRTRLGGVMAPPVAIMPAPSRLTPMLPPPRAYEEPSYAPGPEQPFYDGTPFSLDTPPAPDPAPVAPRVAEAPPPVRSAAPAPAPSVPMVGFRPMRPLGSRSY